MERYFKRKKESPSSTEKKKNDSSAKSTTFQIDLAQLPTDPGLKPPISYYNPNVRDQVRRAYMQMGLCQPKGHDFPSKRYWRRIGKVY